MAQQWTLGTRSGRRHFLVFLPYTVALYDRGITQCQNSIKYLTVIGVTVTDTVSQDGFAVSARQTSLRGLWTPHNGAPGWLMSVIVWPRLAGGGSWGTRAGLMNDDSFVIDTWLSDQCYLHSAYDCRLASTPDRVQNDSRTK